MRFPEEGREWILLVSCIQMTWFYVAYLKKTFRTMAGRFVKVFKKRDLKVNTDKSKVMVLNGKEGLECEDLVDEMRLEHVSEFKH